MTPNGVGVVCALATEARHLSRARLPHGAGRLVSCADGTLVTVSGMGRARAAAGATALIDAGAVALASWGMAGGLAPDLGCGAVLVPRAVLAHDGTRFETTENWRRSLMAAIAVRYPISDASVLTSITPIAHASEKAQLFARTGAGAVDMESAAVAEVAHARRLPFIVVRVIVDTAEDDLPRSISTAIDAHGRARPARLLGALVRSPGDLAALLRLARRYRIANRSLSGVASFMPGAWQ